MNQTEYQRELISFDEKIALSELEESKAKERVKELAYHKARFNLEYIDSVLRAQAAQAQAPTGPPSSPEGDTQGPPKN